MIVCMKPGIQLLVISFFTVQAGSIVAQEPVDSIRLIYTVVAQQERNVILNSMQLAESEKEAFWKVYELYSRDKEPLTMQCIALMTLSRKWNRVISDKDIGTLYAAQLHNDYLLSRMRKVYFRRFKKVLSSLQASQFMELERSLWLSACLRYRQNLPLTSMPVMIVEVETN